MGSRMVFGSRVEKNVQEMRRCLKEAERARNKVFAVRRGYKAAGYTGVELDFECNNDPAYKEGIADNQWYMKQAIMYATAAQTEMKLLELGIEPHFMGLIPEDEVEHDHLAVLFGSVPFDPPNPVPSPR